MDLALAQASPPAVLDDQGQRVKNPESCLPTQMSKTKRVTVDYIGWLLRYWFILNPLQTAGVISSTSTTSVLMSMYPGDLMSLRSSLPLLRFAVRSARSWPPETTEYHGITSIQICICSVHGRS